MIFLKIHEREMIISRAKSEFITEYYKKIEKLEIGYDEIVNAFAQSILNLSLNDNEKIILDKHHQFLDETLTNVIDEYRLTFGESASILSNQISNNMKYLIRYERHGNFDTPGGFQ